MAIRNLKLGDLNQKCYFYRHNYSINASTGDKQAGLATVKAPAWCNISYVGSPSAGSSEEESNEQRTGKMKIEVTCRFFPNLRFDDYFLYEGSMFQIYSIQIIGKKKAYILRAELRDDQTEALPTGYVYDWLQNVAGLA